MHITEEKALLRREIKKRIEELTPTARRAEGRTVSRVLLKKIPEGSTVCAYFPLTTEVDIQLLLTELIARGDTVFLPVYVPATKEMIFRKAVNLDELKPGEFTIPEPPVDAEELKDKRVDLIIVPGRAFDKKGYRLGRGSGGYDAWLSSYKKKHPDTPLWGVCLQCQLVERVPTEPHDVKMDEIITAQELGS